MKEQNTELRIGTHYRWNDQKKAWCTGCSCNSASQTCFQLDQNRIVLGVRDRIADIEGIQHRFSSAVLSYCHSERVAQKAIEQGIARPVTPADFVNKTLIRAY